jgi:hypothetical protein
VITYQPRLDPGIPLRGIPRPKSAHHIATRPQKVDSGSGKYIRDRKSAFRLPGMNQPPRNESGLARNHVVVNGLLVDYNHNQSSDSRIVHHFLILQAVSGVGSVSISSSQFWSDQAA